MVPHNQWESEQSTSSTESLYLSLKWKIGHIPFTIPRDSTMHTLTDFLPKLPVTLLCSYRHLRKNDVQKNSFCPTHHADESGPLPEGSWGTYQFLHRGLPKRRHRHSRHLYHEHEIPFFLHLLLSATFRWPAVHAALWKNVAGVKSCQEKRRFGQLLPFYSCELAKQKKKYTRNVSEWFWRDFNDI